MNWTTGNNCPTMHKNLSDFILRKYMKFSQKFSSLSVLCVERQIKATFYSNFDFFLFMLKIFQQVQVDLVSGFIFNW